MLEVRDLRKNYGATQALAGIYYRMERSDAALTGYCFITPVSAVAVST